MNEFYDETKTVTKTIADLAKDAILVQDACNLSGVLHSMAEAVCILRNETNWNEANKHPIVKMFLFKVMDLCGIDDPDSYSYSTYALTYAACKRLADPSFPR